MRYGIGHNDMEQGPCSLPLVCLEGLRSTVLALNGSWNREPDFLALCASFVYKVSTYPEGTPTSSSTFTVP